MEAYILAIGTAIPSTVMYAISNASFLLVLTKKPMIGKLQRMKNIEFSCLRRGNYYDSSKNKTYSSIGKATKASERR